MNSNVLADFENSFLLKTSFDKQSNKANIKIILKDGYHAYAPGEQVGKPVQIVVNPENGWQLQKPVEMPAGKEKNLGSLGKSYIYEKELNLECFVHSGKGDLVLNLNLQICSESACDMPRVHNLRMKTH